MKRVKVQATLACLAFVGLVVLGQPSQSADNGGNLERVSEREIAQRPSELSRAKTPPRRDPTKMLPKQLSKTAAAVKALPPLSPEAEQQVLVFVETHQSELGELLRYLKSQLPREYQRAILDLERTQQRLAQTERRDPERYALELKLWQTQSQAQLLAAQIRTQPTDKPTLSATLRDTLKQAQEIRLQLMEREREKLLERAEKIAANIERIRENAERLVEREMATLTPPETSDAPRRSGASTKAATDKATQP